MMRRLGAIFAVAMLAAALVLGLPRTLKLFGGAPDPTTIATASLEGLREQNRLTPFVARFVAVVTSTQTRFGLTARKTLIMPGLVRYEVDLGKLRQRDLAWNAASRTLTVTLPPVELAGPEVDMTAIREYDSGGVLMALTNAEATLDQANRAAGQRQLVAQAREPLPLRLARDAARNAIARSFALPLRAAGLDATVRARFADEPDASLAGEVVDRSRDPRAVLAEGR